MLTSCGARRCPATTSCPSSAQLRRCQYVYVCTSKASELSTAQALDLLAAQRLEGTRDILSGALGSSSVSICTFVLVKQVN
jgi:hypothetical protein